MNGRSGQLIGFAKESKKKLKKKEGSVGEGGVGRMGEAFDWPESQMQIETKRFASIARSLQVVCVFGARIVNC